MVERCELLTRVSSEKALVGALILPPELATAGAMEEIARELRQAFKGLSHAYITFFDTPEAARLHVEKPLRYLEDGPIGEFWGDSRVGEWWKNEVTHREEFLLHFASTKPVWVNLDTGERHT